MVVSIYYNRSSWHDLITNVIQPFIRQEQDNLEAYYFYFGTSQGDHVTFAARPQDNTDNFQKRFSILLEQFLLSRPSASKVISYPLQSFFMDYPNNSFHFNKNKLIAYSENTIVSDLIKHHISKSIIDAFGSEEVDNESIYTFIIYMQLGIIRAANSTFKQALESSIQIENYLKNQEVWENNEIERETIEYDQEDFKLLFDNNKEMLVEIIGQIWAETNYSSELSWLETWEFNCKQSINEFGFERSFVLLTELICEHLGLNGKKLPYLSSKLILNSFKHLCV